MFHDAVPVMIDHEPSIASVHLAPGSTNTEPLVILVVQEPNRVTTGATLSMMSVKVDNRLLLFSLSVSFQGNTRDHVESVTGTVSVRILPDHTCPVIKTLDPLYIVMISPENHAIPVRIGLICPVL